MNTDEIKIQVQKFWDAFNRGDPEAQLALATNDVVFAMTGATVVSGSYEGRDAAREHFARFGTLFAAGASRKSR